MRRVGGQREEPVDDALRHLAQPGRVVLLVAGVHHVDATCGVPLHLAGSGLALRTVRLGAGAAMGESTPGFDETWATPPLPPRDPCAELQRSLGDARP